MTTNDMIESFIDAGIKAYKKNHKRSRCLQARKLDRHEPVEVAGIEGITFCYWRELVIYKMAEYIQDCLPNANVKAILDGNNSTLEIELDDIEQRSLNSKMFIFLQSQNLL